MKLATNKRKAAKRNRSQCKIVDVGKRRDGGTRYWCLRHKADATAKYGKPASTCRAAHIPPIKPSEIFELNLGKYKGGIALWGAVPAVYDTTTLPMDRGIHVHARVSLDAKKEIDETFRAVKITSNKLPDSGILVSELDAIYYMVSSMFGYEMRFVECTHCGYPHLDKDWFSVNPHRRHLCAGCGKKFNDSVVGVGNPIIAARQACGVGKQKTKQSKRKLVIKQIDYPGGIQIWGSNPAFLWTSSRPEEEGIHVHAFADDSGIPTSDETYGKVVIDGIELDAEMVRVLMAQSAMPSIRDRIRSIDCPTCGEPKFSKGASAYTLIIRHECSKCGDQFTAPGRLKKTIANPLAAILDQLAQFAPRSRQTHDFDLLAEMP